MADEALNGLFEAAQKRVNNLVARPTDAELLEIYALYKQATLGPCSVSCPGVLDFKGRAKWDAWNALGNMPRADAKFKYYEKSVVLADAYGEKGK